LILERRHQVLPVVDALPRQLRRPRATTTRIVEHHPVSIDHKLKLRSTRGHPLQRELDTRRIITLPPQRAVTPRRKPAIAEDKRRRREPRTLPHEQPRFTAHKRHLEQTTRKANQNRITTHRRSLQVRALSKSEKRPQITLTAIKQKNVLHHIKQHP